MILLDNLLQYFTQIISCSCRQCRTLLFQFAMSLDPRPCITVNIRFLLTILNLQETRLKCQLYLMTASVLMAQSEHLNSYKAHTHTGQCMASQAICQYIFQNNIWLCKMLKVKGQRRCRTCFPSAQRHTSQQTHCSFIQQ